MIKQYLNVLMMLFASWSVYASCQSDVFLPAVCGGLVVLSLLPRLNSAEKRYAAFAAFPLSVLILGSLIFGFFWRNVVPIPEEAGSVFPEFTAALQSGSILAAALLAFRPLSKTNLYGLTFCAWLTVALSINVPFSLERLIVFSAFCFISIMVVILNTMKRPVNQKYLLSYFRDYVVFAALLIFLTTGLFFVISRSIVALDNAFLNIMSELVMPRHFTHFLRISPKLNLIPPGMSAFDRRPVFEVSIPGVRAAYFKLQVFEEYDNGTWLESKIAAKRPLPDSFSVGDLVAPMMMFVSLDDILPTPVGVNAVRGRSRYEKDQHDIVYADDKQKTRILEFSLTPGRVLAAQLSDEEHRTYTALPSSIADRLRQIAYEIAQDQTDPLIVAQKFVDHFQRNYGYSLSVNYSADDEGLLKMIQEKQPAYCTYFASALTLLLRAQGVPARVVAGFLTDEVIDSQKGTLIGRVKDAHAWTEALVTITDPASGQPRQAWVRFDPTPTGVSAPASRPKTFDLQRTFEQIWLSFLRLNARIENIDKDRLKVYAIAFLLLVMALINRRQISQALGRWLTRPRRPAFTRHKVSDELVLVYRQYEQLLEKRYREVRRGPDTDSEILDRIKAQPAVDLKAVHALENFVREFHSVRFGGRPAARLKQMLQQCADTRGPA